MQLWSDPLVTRHTSGRPLSRQEVWTRLLRHPGLWALLGFGYWLAFERATERFAGEVGAAQFERDVMQARPEVAALPEAGWVLLPWAHVAGRGTFCLIHPENAPSLRLAARLGFQVRGDVGDAERPLTLLTREQG